MKHAEQAQTLATLELYASRLGFVINKKESSSDSTNLNDKTQKINGIESILEKHELYLFPQKKPEINLQLPWLLPEEESYWNKHLNKHYKQCGCGHGAAFLLLGSIWIILDLLFYGLHDSGLRYLIVSSMFLLGLSLTGKLLAN